MRSVRVEFKKFGLAKYISHLDLNRFMIKIIRRSGIPVWYSEGFNPHPYITFAQPLSLGFESDYELMDIRLDDDSFTNEEVLNAIKDLMPEGIEVVSCNDPIMKAGDIAFAEFKVSFENASDKVLEDLEKFLSMPAIITQKKTKKGSLKDIDVKEFIKSFSVDNSALKLVLSAGGSNNLNPKLVLDVFEKHTETKLPYYLISRNMLFNDKMEIFK